MVTGVPASIILGIYLPITLALVAAVIGVAPMCLLRNRGPGATTLLRQPTLMAALIVGAIAIALHSPGPSLLAWLVATTILLSLAVFPVVALRYDEDSDQKTGAARFKPAGRLIWILVAMLMLVLAESVQRTLGLADSLIVQAVDQVGEIRLAGFRPDVTGDSLYQYLLLQSLLVFPFFLPALPMFLPTGPMLWFLGLYPVVQALYTLPSALLSRLTLPRAGIPPGILAVLCLGIGLHPFVMDKSSWDFIPPGTVLFVLAWLAEARRRRTLLSLSLILAALCHPIQAVMAVTWALDHARRSWRAPQGHPSDDYRRVIAVPLVVGLAALLPVGVMLAGPLFPEGHDLASRLAPFSRRWLSAALSSGEWSWIPTLLATNATKFILLLLPLGLLPVLRWNRFLAYSAAGFLYSMTSLNGFMHGSLPGFVGLMGCAAIENAPRLAPTTLKRAGSIAALTLLPLTLWWGGLGFATSLLRTEPIDRLTALSSLLGPEDRHRTCVGQSSTYPFLAGRCEHTSPLRFNDDVSSTVSRSADVYILDLSRLQEAPVTKPLLGLNEILSDAARRSVRLPPEAARIFALDTNIADEDLRWIRDRVVAGELAIIVWRDGILRLDRAPGDAPTREDRAEDEVRTTIDDILAQRIVLRNDERE